MRRINFKTGAHLSGPVFGFPLLFAIALSGCWSKEPIPRPKRSDPGVREVRFEGVGSPHGMRLELRFLPPEHGEQWMERFVGAAFLAWKTCKPSNSVTLPFLRVDGQWVLREQKERRAIDRCLANGVIEQIVRSQEHEKKQTQDGTTLELTWNISS